MAVQHVRKVPFQSVSKLDRESQRQLSRNFDTLVSQLVPTGTIVPWAGQDGLDPPQGWALCDGTHPGPGHSSLFRVIGTTFGGTNVNDFLTPNMSDRFIRGTHLGSEVGDQGGSATASMPSHNHGAQDTNHHHYVWGNNFNTGNPSANHSHWSGADSGGHNHTHGGGTSGGFGISWPSTQGLSNASVTAQALHTHLNGVGNHNHGQSGTVSAWHTHNANHDHGTDWQSRDFTNYVHTHTSEGSGDNNPPFTDFRFIIKT